MYCIIFEILQIILLYYTYAARYLSCSHLFGSEFPTLFGHGTILNLQMLTEHICFVVPHLPNKIQHMYL